MQCNLDLGSVLTAAGITVLGLEILKYAAPKFLNGKEKVAAVTLPLGVAVIGKLLGYDALDKMAWGNLVFACLAGSVVAKAIHDALAPTVDPLVSKTTKMIRGQSHK